MFNQNNGEKKLDWMYKGPNSMVEREEYLLGRKVDKTLEQLNEEEKLKQQNIIIPPKNRVEHECIPPSIRDFNKVVQAEQVDLSTKLQEDPLVAIKKREEETRRQFLQNPVQLKKLQKALKAQQAQKKKKKKKSKQSSDSNSDLDIKLTEKLLGKKKKISKEERNLDTILIHKFEALKDKLTESDLQDILNGIITSSEDSSEDEEKSRKKYSKKRQDSEKSEDGRKHKKKDKRRETFRRERDSSDDDSQRRKKPDRSHQKSKTIKEYKKDSHSHRSRNRSPNNKKSNDKRRSSSSNSEREEEIRNSHSKKYDSDSDSSRHKKRNYGLVSSDGKKIPLSRKHNDVKEITKPKVPEPPPPVQRHRAKKLTEEEKEKLRQEMMQNAVLRDKERERNVRKYREKEEKEKKEQNFDPEFIHKQLIKSADSGSVESRIKSNLNNIQRSSKSMDHNFSRR